MSRSGRGGRHGHRRARLPLAGADQPLQPALRPLLHRLPSRQRRPRPADHGGLRVAAAAGVRAGLPADAVHRRRAAAAPGLRPAAAHRQGGRLRLRRGLLQPHPPARGHGALRRRGRDPLRHVGLLRRPGRARRGHPGAVEPRPHRRQPGPAGRERGRHPRGDHPDRPGAGLDRADDVLPARARRADRPHRRRARLRPRAAAARGARRDARPLRPLLGGQALRRPGRRRVRLRDGSRVDGRRRAGVTARGDRARGRAGGRAAGGPPHGVRAPGRSPPPTARARRARTGRRPGIPAPAGRSRRPPRRPPRSRRPARAAAAPAAGRPTARRAASRPS